MSCCFNNTFYIYSYAFTSGDKWLTLVISKLWFTFRYLSKSRRGVRSLKSKELRSSHEQTWKHDKPTTLTIALSRELQLKRYDRPMRYDILMLIASKLHYADTVFLSLVSQALRQMIFPPYIRAVKSETLRIQSCKNGTKTECWVCRTQICRVDGLTTIDFKNRRSS